MNDDGQPSDDSSGNSTSKSTAQRSLEIHLQETLQQIRDGAISPEQAADRLLQDTSSEHPPSPSQQSLSPPPFSPLQQTPQAEPASESLLAIINRLGTPPPDVLDNWRDQFTAIAQSHELYFSEPIPPPDASRWHLDSSGHIVWLDAPDSANLASPEKSESSRPSMTSLDRIERFLDFIADHDEPYRSPVSDGTPDDETLASGLSQYGESSRVEKKRQTAAMFAEAIAKRQGRPLAEASGTSLRERGSNANSSKVSTIAYAVFGLLAIGALVGIIINSQQSNESRNATVQLPEQTVSPRQSIARNELDAEASSASPQPSEPADLQMLQPELDGPGQSLKDELIETQDDRISVSNPLAMTVPAQDHAQPDATANEKNDTPSEPESMVDSLLEDVAEPPKLDGKRLDAVDDVLPPEQPQVTTDLITQSVLLPPRDDVQNVIQLGNANSLPTGLSFPFEIPLALDQVDGKIRIMDSRQNIPVGEFTKTPDDVVEFRWAPEAITTSSSGYLPHGRVDFGDAGSSYLRPTVQAKPLQILFETPNTHPTWDLHASLPPRVSRLAIDVDTPEEIEYAWIKTHEPDAPQRTSGFLVFTPTDGETIALAVQMDLRCSRKLSCRIRLGCRLDSSMPWQLLSRPLLNQMADQVTVALQSLTNQRTQMDAAYDNATNAERRVLRVRRDPIDSAYEKTQIFAQRLQELRALMERVERDVRLRLNVTVLWPEDAAGNAPIEQTLFEMVAPSE
ncbi:hypothetical protein [Stieleria varia]|uniref:Transmembrane protein n=1 Tax=Stieleria varia TaxID=2528005 RepID=A0A5C6AXA8_9BACT|nr:hypothetical protein [Stieleria varia]TWU04268.1 hypothetical protein Pla52n_23070 [Stieleria varia]